MDKRTGLMQVAMRLFIEQGFHGCSVQEMARHAGMATGSFYRYFSSKEELIRQLYRNSIKHICDIVFQHVDLERTCFASYRQMWFNGCQGIQNHADVMLFKDLYERSPFFSAEDRAWTRQKWQPLDDFFQRGIDQGLFRDMPACLLGALSLATVQCVQHEHKFYDFELTDSLKEHMAEASWQAILVSPSSLSGREQ